MKATSLGTVMMSLVIVLGAQEAGFDGKSWFHHIQVLAADDMEGRGTGTAGLERAEAYVVERLRSADVLPAGVDGYYQPVSLESRELVEADCDAALVRAGKLEPLMLSRDAFFSTFVDLAPVVDAPLVFVGYGLRVPERNYDDFAGLDLKGKVAVAIPAAPDGIDGAAAVLANAQRQTQYPETGLLGWVWLSTSGAGWPALVAASRFPSMDLRRAEGTLARQVRLSINPERAEPLFVGTDHTATELFALARDHKPLPRFDLPVSLRARTRTTKKFVTSTNVIGRIEGSDPVLKNEYVVLSAHLDHLGIGVAVEGDSIYNGAIDNASGVAALLDLAERFKRDGIRPKRSVLFAFFTGEEQGMLGSKYFVAHPTVGLASIVADVNVDSIYAFAPLRSILVLGHDESTLGDSAVRAITSQHVAVARDPNNRGICCSDQFSFIERDIPAVKLEVDFPGESHKLEQDWMRDRVHKPSDDAQQPLDLNAAAKYEEIVWRLVLDAASEPRPEWKATSEFHRRRR